jgi:hypothetical protein
LPALIPDITELNAGTALDGSALIWDSMELKAGTPVGSRTPVGRPPGTDVAPDSRELTIPDGRFETAPDSPDAGLPEIELAPAICESKELTTPAGRPEG